jgi:putative acetyltransferase
MLTIRTEQREDAGAVYRVNAEAFGREVEARLVEAIRRSEAYLPELSLVVEREGSVVAHVLFSKVHIEGSEQAERLLALGPVAVLPAWQRQGIGTALVRAGLERAAALGFAGVVLVGHPSYYPRFGFQPARQFGLRVPFPVEEDAFMALPLRPGGLDAAAGTVVFSEPFQQI